MAGQVRTPQILAVGPCAKWHGLTAWWIVLQYSYSKRVSGDLRYDGLGNGWICSEHKPLFGKAVRLHCELEKTSPAATAPIHKCLVSTECIDRAPNAL